MLSTQFNLYISNREPESGVHVRFAANGSENGASECSNLMRWMAAEQCRASKTAPGARRRRNAVDLMQDTRENRKLRQTETDGIICVFMETIFMRNSSRLRARRSSGATAAAAAAVRAVNAILLNSLEYKCGFCIYLQ